MIVDIVTNRRAQMHNELVRLLEKGDAFLMPEEPLYAVAYRAVRHDPAKTSSPQGGNSAPAAYQDQVEIWPTTFAVGQALPTLPLSLDKGQYVSVPLEATYMESCQKLRLI